MTLVQMTRVHRFMLKVKDGYICFFIDDGSGMVFTLLKLKCHVYRQTWLPIIIVMPPIGN